MGDFFQGVFQNVIDSFGNILAAIWAAVPGSPFEAISNSAVADYLPWLNWLVPLNQMVAVLELWVTAIIAWYIIMVIMRWVKAVQ